MAISPLLCRHGLRAQRKAAVHGVAEIEDTTDRLHFFPFHFKLHWKREWQPSPVLFLPGEPQDREPGGLRLSMRFAQIEHCAT